MRKNIFSSILIAIVVLALYIFWFVISDPRLTFLYGHLHSTPYDAMTLSRHFMTALVAGGVVFFGYTVINLILKRIKASYKVPVWQQVWRASALILAIPVLVIVAFLSQPALGMIFALWTVLLLVLALRLALQMGDYMVTNFKQSIFTFLDSLSLVPALILIPLGVAFALRRDLPQALILIPVLSVGAGLLWLAIMTLIQKKLKRQFSAPKNILLAAATVTYLLAPFFHYLISRPQHLYVSNAANFFSRDILTQVLTWAIGVGMLFLAGLWRKNNNLRSLVKVLLGLLVVTIIGYGMVYLETDKSQDIWVCENDQWVKQGEPAYEQPLPEECGIIDKLMMN